MNNTETFDLTFLGTGASDFSNRLKTDCKDRFDRDARRSSAVLINSGYLIDAGVFVLDSLRIAKREPNQITDIFVTHFHNDHFLRENVEKIAKDKPRALRIWVRDSAEVDPIENVTVIKMKPFERYAVSNGLFVTGLPVNHDETTFPQHLLLEKDHKKVFYGCDGAWFLNATYRFLRGSGTFHDDFGLHRWGLRGGLSHGGT